METLKDKMKAIYLIKYGEAAHAFETRECPIPMAAEDELLVKVSHSGINFADVLARKGMYDDAPKIPCVLGYDISGEVVDLGSKVTAFQKGQKVFALSRFGGYAEYVVVKALAAAVIPESMDEATATCLATQACTAYYCAVESVTLHEGDVVLIQAAAGGVGSMLVQIAKSAGCKVYATASTAKIQTLVNAGVDCAIDYTKEDFAEVIKRSGDSGVDVVFDSLGGMAFKKAFNLLKPAGKMVCYGAAEQMDSATNKLKLLSLAYGFGLFSPISLLMQSKALIMVNMLRIADHKPLLFNHLLKSVVGLSNVNILQPHIGRVFPVEEVALAHQYVESRQSIGKVVLKWK